jgi:prepilin-type N-terminal cleavage/methylation domain-containing protein
MRNKKGMTLVEVIVVVAILGTLLGIAAISASTWLERYKVEGQIKQMYTDLMNARVSAMQRNRIFFVTVAANQYAIYEDNYNAAAGTTTYDGDGILQQGTDKLVTKITTQYALNCTEPFVAATGNFYFTQNGLVTASSGTSSVTVQVPSSAGPVSDCIWLTPTRILMGKMNGTNCIAQ